MISLSLRPRAARRVVPAKRRHHGVHVRQVLRTASLLLTAFVFAACATNLGPEPVSSPLIVTDRSAAEFPHGAVAADHEIASRAGAEMLALGGNAVDAAVAASFALSVVRPYSCGIGGGGFMVIHLEPATLEQVRAREAASGGKQGVVADIALNYREMTPGAVDPYFYERRADPLASRRGGAAAGVPGTVAGLLHALEHFGTLDRATVLAPAIRAAKNGFPADEHYVDNARDLIKQFEERPEWKQRFAFVWDRFLRSGNIKVGDVIRNPEQACALEFIALAGARVFYDGPIGGAIVNAAKTDGGVISLDDLRSFKVARAEPIRFPFAGYEFVAMPPPSSGGLAMAEAFGILGRRGFDGYASRGWTSESLHLYVEALKHAFADRAEWLGDPAFVEVPVARLLSRSYLDERAGLIDPVHTKGPGAYGTRAATGSPGAAPTPDSGTSHLCAVDARGNAVACTETINLEFGSLLAVPEFGFCLNDQMDDFLTRRGEPNAFKLVQSERNLPAPGKRPLSSMSPTIVLSSDGRASQVVAIAGASGGPRIITGTSQALINALVFGMDAGDALDHPRVHHQWMPDHVLFERGWSGETGGDAALDGLRERGHVLERTDAVADVQLIRRARSGSGWQAACDPRKGGKPAGN